MPVLVDSNVLLDIICQDKQWGDWSANAVASYLESDLLFINPLIYAEICAAYQTIEEVETVLPPTKFLRSQLPWEAAFLASRCYLEYRARGGTRRSPMPDFYIGAHAVIAGMSLLTRDAQRYRTYFPKLKLITPDI